MSSVFRLAGGQFSTLLHGKKGGEKFLPKCVHFHVAKSTRNPLAGFQARYAPTPFGGGDHQNRWRGDRNLRALSKTHQIFAMF